MLSIIKYRKTHIYSESFFHANDISKSRRQYAEKLNMQLAFHLKTFRNDKNYIYLRKVFYNIRCKSNKESITLTSPKRSSTGCLNGLKYTASIPNFSAP